MLRRWRRAVAHLYGVASKKMDECPGRDGLSQLVPRRNCSKVAATAAPDSVPRGSPPKTNVKLNALFWSKPFSLALAPDSPLKIEEPQYEGIKRLMLKLLLFYSKQSKAIRGANVVYRRVITQVDKPAIYDGYFLNPRYEYNDTVHNDGEVFTGTIDGIHCLSRNDDDMIDAEREMEPYWLRFSTYGAREIQHAVMRLSPVFHLEKTFKTTFSLLVLHMWLVLRRLKEEGKEGVDFGQYLYETYNHDLELRVSKAGVNLLLTKWMKDLEKIFYGNIVAYDAAMSPEARNDDLLNVIWRNIFADDGSPMPNGAAADAVKALSRYTRRESTCLSLTDKEAIFSGNFMFTSLENQISRSELSLKR